MNVFVTVETCKGVIAEARVFLMDTSARKAEQKWLRANRVKNKGQRQGKADNGTEFLLLECKLEP